MTVEYEEDIPEVHEIMLNPHEGDKIRNKNMLHNDYLIFTNMGWKDSTGHRHEWEPVFAYLKRPEFNPETDKALYGNDLSSEYWIVVTD